VAAAGQIAATRDEEAEGHDDHLVARRAGRLHWLAGRLLADVTLIIVASLAVGLAGGAELITNRCLADPSVLHHINPVPAADLDRKSATWLVGLAIATTTVGGVGFKLRDLAGT
jgi:putative exporter of polyketide antibiotics